MVFSLNTIHDYLTKQLHIITIYIQEILDYNHASVNISVFAKIW